MKYIILIFTLLLLVFPKDAQAQNSVSLGVFPPILEINADPPALVESNIALQNLSERAVNLDILLKPFRLSSSRDGQIEFISDSDKSEPYDIILEKVKLIDVEAEEQVETISLVPFEAREYKLEIDVEENDPVGDYYFTIVFLAQGQEHPDSSSSLASGGIGTNVIFRLGERGETKGEILEFSAPGFSTSGPVPFALLIKNNSTHYITPTGTLHIKNMFGQEIERLDILPQYILAGSERYLRDEEQASPSAELSNIIDRLADLGPRLIWTENFLLGLYTAEARVKLSENGPLFVTKTTFFALPFYILFAFSFFTFILLGIWLKVRQKIKK